MMMLESSLKRAVYSCWFGHFSQNFLVILVGFKVSTPILCEVLPKQLFMALIEDASFLF